VAAAVLVCGRKGLGMRKLLVGLVVACAWVVGGGVARGQCEGRFVDWAGQERPGVNGETTCAVEWDPDGEGPSASVLVLGGDFTIAGSTMAGSVATWDGAEWWALGSTAFRWVTDLAVFRGELYLCGGGPSNITNPRLWKWSGSSWLEVPGAGAALRLHVQGDELMIGLAGGGGVRAYNGSSVRTLGAAPASEDVTALSSMNGVLYAAFDEVYRVYSWDGAAWQPMGTGHRGTVRCMTEHNGQVLIGGFFPGSSGESAATVKRWTGTSWVAMGTQHVGTAYSFAMYGGELHACTNDGAWRWTGAVWAAPSFPSLGRGRYLSDFRGELIAHGGYFWDGDRYLSYVARYDGEGWEPAGRGLTFPHLTTGATVQSMVSTGSSLFIAGRFTQAFSEPLRDLARWTGERWEPLGVGFGGNTSQASTALLADGEGVVVGGVFAAPAVVRNVARWEAGVWTQLGNGWPGAQVQVLGRWAGAVTAYGGSKVGVWDGSQWIETAASVVGSVGRLLEYRGELIAAGSFTSIGGEPIRSVARWDGAAWRSLGLGVDGNVTSACVFNGELYVSGSFNNAGGSAAPHVARWNGERWEAVSTNVEVFGAATGVGALGVFQGRLIASATLPTWTRGLMQFDGDGWVLLHSSTDAPVSAMCEHEGNLVVGGAFTTIGGRAASGCAVYRLDAEAHRFVQQPRLDVPFSDYGDPVQLSAVLRVSGRVTYRWRRDGVELDSNTLGSPGQAMTDYAISKRMNAGMSTGGRYDVAVFDDCGAFLSDPLVVDYIGGCSTVDIGRSGGIEGPDQVHDNNDFIVFIDRFFAGDLRADYGVMGGDGRDGVLDNNDFVGFISWFFWGCRG
jgi:hypothetical protein